MRIRIGNDFNVVWSIYRISAGNKVAEDLSAAKNIKLLLRNTRSAFFVVLSPEIAGNQLLFEVPSSNQQTGDYMLELSYDIYDNSCSDGLRHITLDREAFTIVDRSYKADATNSEDLSINALQLSSEFSAGINGSNGLSAYELAVHYEGFTGTVEEYLTSLRQPAIEAKEEVDVALVGYEELKNELEGGEESRIYNEQLRVSSETARTSAEATRASNENARVASETARVEAEEVRESAEGNRVDAEVARATAEDNRTTADDSRVTAETARATAETTRASAESQRVANENTRGANEASRVAAETARVASEDNRVSAESARGINEGARVAAETTRAGAEVTRANNETDRVASETARVEAEEVRVAFFDTVSGRISELESQRVCYGVEFTRGLDPAMTRWIGDTAYQSSHPVMAMFKVAKVKDGKVTGYFNQVNLFKMEDRTDSNIIIDGTIVTDDGSDVMLVNESPIYVLNGGTNETYERRLVGKVPFVYDGDAAIEIPAHGVCIDYSTIKDGKQRSIRDNTVAGTGGAGIGGISYLANGLGGIKTEVSRFNYELYARAKNTDTSKNVPYCNSFWLDRDVWHTLLCIKFKTKNYHGSAYAGKALSSNDSVPTVSTWGTVTGVRVNETNATVSYYNISGSRFSAASGQPVVNFWTLLNGQRPLLKMFEAQLALSYAYANSIAADTDFSYDGATYQYANIAGHKGLADGEMTAKLRKKVTVSFTGRDVTNNVDVTNMQIDYLLEQVIIKGRVATWGHLYCWTSGIDAWTDNTNYHFYQTTDVNKVTIDTDSAEKDPGVKYAFEDTYQKVQQIANGDGWVLRMNNNSLIIKNNGGSLHTGECAYLYKSGTGTAGKKARRGVLAGGFTHNSYSASRSVFANGSPALAATYFSGNFRVELIK